MGSLNDRLLPYFQHKNSIGKHTASTSIQQKQKCDSADISSVELLISRNYGSQIFWRKKQSGIYYKSTNGIFSYTEVRKGEGLRPQALWRLGTMLGGEGREMVGGKESHPYKEGQLYIYAVQ
jgi:hypothetical protein